MICRICKREIGENTICPYCYSKNNKYKIYDYNDVSLKENQYLEEMTLENFGKHIGGFLYTDNGAVFVYKSDGGDFVKNSEDKKLKIFIIICIVFLLILPFINIDFLKIISHIDPIIIKFLCIGAFIPYIIFHYQRSKAERLALCIYQDGIDLFNDKNKELIINIPKEKIKEFCIEPITIDKDSSNAFSYKLCIKSDYEIIKKKSKMSDFGNKIFDLGIHVNNKNKLLFLKQEFEKILGISDKTYYLLKEIK